MWLQFATGAGFQVVSPLLPIISEDYGITHGTAGILVGLPLVILGLFGIPGAAIIGRLGERRSYTLAWLMMGAVILTVLSPGFIGLLVLRVIFGIGIAIGFPATGAILMQWFRPRELTIITSLNIACMPLGIMVGIATGAPLAGSLGWEGVLGVHGGMALAGAAVWFVLGKSGPRAANVHQKPLPAWGEIWTVVRNRTVLLLVLADTSCFMMYIALSGWLPTFLNESRGMSLNQAGFVTSLLAFVGMFAVLAGGVLPLKIKSKALLFAVPGAVAALGGLGTFLFESTPLIYVSVILLGIGSWLYIPSLMTLAVDLPDMTPKRVAIVWGWLLTVPGIGGFVSPLVVGTLKDSFDSFIPGFLLFSVLAWFLVIAGFLLPKAYTPPKTPLPDATLPAASAID